MPTGRWPQRGTACQHRERPHKRPHALDALRARVLLSGERTPVIASHARRHAPHAIMPPEASTGVFKMLCVWPSSLRDGPDTLTLPWSSKAFKQAVQQKENRTKKNCTESIVRLRSGGQSTHKRQTCFVYVFAHTNLQTQSPPCSRHLPASLCRDLRTRKFVESRNTTIYNSY